MNHKKYDTVENNISDTSHYENVPFEVPQNWCWAILPELCLIPITDGTHQTPTYTSKENGIPFISSKDVTSQKINWDNIKYITKELHEELYKRVAPQKNDILLAKNGTTGVAAIVEDSRVFDIYVTLAVIRPSQNISPQYLYRIINSGFCKEQFDSHLTGIGLPNLHLTDIKKTIIPLPPYAEQIRIVAEIEKWFALIDRIENGKTELQTTIKQAKNKILDLAIHGKLVSQDPNDDPASELLKRINPNAEITCDNGQYGKLPKGWCLCKLGDIGEIVTGSTPTKDISEYYGGIIPFYKPADLENGICVKDASDHLSILGYEQARKIPAYSILITCIGATIGKTGLIIAEGSCNQQINAIIPNETTYAKFLYYTCISDYMQKEIKLNASATTLPILNKGNFAKLLFPLPPLTEQHRIVAKIEDLFSSLDNIQKSLEA